MSELESYLIQEINSLEEFFCNEDVADHKFEWWCMRKGELVAFNEVLAYVRSEA